MAGDGGLRVGPYVPEPDDTPDQQATGAQASQAGEWWEDAAEPWDHQLADTETPPEGAGASGSARDEPQPAAKRRSKRDTGLRRTAVVVVLVGLVLIGSGLLANLLRPDTSALPLPPPTAPEEQVSSSPDRISRLDTAPSPTTSPSPTPGPGTATGGVPAPEGDRPATGSAGPEEDEGDTDDDDGGTPDSGQQSPERISIEAEAADLAGLANSYSNDEASGGQAVGSLGWLGLSHVEFTGITVAEDGEYDLTFHYLTGRDRTAQFAVDDGSRQTLEFPAVPDGGVGEVTVTLELAAGDHTVWFGSGGFRSAPDLDRITITG